MRCIHGQAGIYLKRGQRQSKPAPAREPHPYRASNAVHPTMSRMSRGRWRVATLTKLLPSSPTLAAPVMLSGKVKSLLGEPGWNSSPAFTGTAMRAFALL